MINDNEFDIVLDHVVTRIAAGVGNVSEWRKVTPDQLRLIGGRLVAWRVQSADMGRALMRQADELANPSATMADSEVLSVVDSPALRVLLMVDGWQQDARQFTGRQIRRLGDKLKAFGAEQLAEAEMLTLLAERRERKLP